MSGDNPGPDTVAVRPFDREELVAIRERAEFLLRTENTPNPTWRRAYGALALAADHLDAMIARTEVRGDSPIERAARALCALGDINRLLSPEATALYEAVEGER